MEAWKIGSPVFPSSRLPIFQPSNLPSFRRSSAFTLLEVLLAVTILALVITAVYSTWSAALTGWKRGTAVADALQRQRIVTDTLSELAGSAVFFGANIQDYQMTGVHDESQGDTVSFVTASDVLLPPNELMLAGMRRVTIGMQRDDSGRPFLALTNSPVLSDGETAETPHVLSADVVAFTTRYRDPRDGTWKDEWKETKVIPSALEFTVGFASDNGASSLPIVVTRAVELPSSTYAMQSIGQPVNQRNSTNAVQRRDVPLANPPASGGKPRGSRR